MSEIGKLFIDGYDAYIKYGISIARYGYKQVIQMPAFKKLDSTEWPEEDGAEVDLTSPELDTRTLQIDFDIINIQQAEDLFNQLRKGVYHEFNFAELNKAYKLRMTQNTKFSFLLKLGALAITFSDDFPSVPTGTHYQLGVTEVRQVGYKVDGIDLSQFGVWVLKGTDENIRKASNTKENLKISTKNKEGVSYDDSEVYYKPKDVTFNLLIDAPSVEEFWERYNGIFALLLQPGSRTFNYNGLGTAECYYNKSTVSKFDILRSGKVWCEFSITLTFTGYNQQ